jgi:cupin fold WbuC family metalloprotein
MTDAIFFVGDDVCLIEPHNILSLRNPKLTHDSSNFRLVLGAHTDAYQQMVIFLKKGVFYSPHKNKYGRKSYILLSGVMKIVIYNANNSEIYELTHPSTILSFPAKIPHSLKALTDVSYIESVAGPYLQNKSELFSI